MVFKFQILVIAGGMLPDVIYDVFETTVNELFTRRRNALLSVGFVLSLYYASLGINTLLTAFSQSYQLKLKTNYFKQQLLSLGIFLIMIVLFISATTISIVGDQVHEQMGNMGSSAFIQFGFRVFSLFTGNHHGNVRDRSVISFWQPQYQKIQTN